MSMIDIYKAQAEHALAERSRLVGEVREINASDRFSLAEKRTKIDRLNSQIEHLADDARAAINEATRETEVRRMTAGNSPLYRGGASSRSEDEWETFLPSISEIRAAGATTLTLQSGGYAVPTGVADKAIEMLRAKSVFLQAPGLNIVRVEDGIGNFILPGISSFSDPAVTAESATITEGSQTFSGGLLNFVKFADYRTSSAELLQDSQVDVRELLGREMIRAVASKVDVACFGNGNGTTNLKGLTASGQSVNTALATGNTQIGWDHIIQGYADCLASGAQPSVIFVSADQYGGLLRQRESGATGGYLAGSVTGDPVSGALGLPILVSSNVGTRTAVVADGSRLFFGVKRQPTVAVSEDYRFQDDVTAFRLTWRVAGVYVAEAASVQRITASAT